MTVGYDRDYLFSRGRERTRVRDSQRSLVETRSWVETVAAMDWQQGEHVTIVGPTGSGKTEVIDRLLEVCTYWVFFGTKNNDPTQTALREHHAARVVRDPREIVPQATTKYILRPGRPENASVAQIKNHQRAVFRRALMTLYGQGNWTIIPDELRYLAEFLGLKDELTLQWLQGRSEGVSLICGTQRPKFVPLEAYSQATHLFFFRDVDMNNVARIAEIVSVHRTTILKTVPNLPVHDVLYVNTRTGELSITNTRS